MARNLPNSHKWSGWDMMQENECQDVFDDKYGVAVRDNTLTWQLKGTAKDGAVTMKALTSTVKDDKGNQPNLHESLGNLTTECNAEWKGAFFNHFLKLKVLYKI